MSRLADQPVKPAQIHAPKPESSPAAAPSDASAPPRTGSRPAAIEVRNLSKLYKIYPTPSAILKEIIWRKPMHKQHWALRDVSFDVHRGEIVGVVGANGAGKSTLLRILASTLDHNGGSFTIHGKLRAILQLGSGFHEEYSGRENVFMGGYCLGYSKREIEESYDWIVDFSGLAHVIDQPVRTYSSGMKSRLAFAVTFCKRPDILIVDEALATGDLAFQQKCTNRILDLCSGGSTALIVSHSMFFIETLCSRSIYLRDGRLVADGKSREITEMYERELLDEFAKKQSTSASGDSPAAIDLVAAAHDSPRRSAPAHTPAPPPQQPVDEDDPSYPPLTPDIQELLDDPEDLCPAIKHLNLVKLRTVRLLDENDKPCDRFHTGHCMRVEIEVESKVHKDNVAVGVQIFNEADIHVLTSTNLTQLDDRGNPDPTPMNLRRGIQKFVVEFPRLFLCDGRYHLGIGIAPKARHFTEADQLMRSWRVATFGFYRRDLPYKQIYDPPSRWKKILPPRNAD